MTIHPSHEVNRRWWNEVTPIHVSSEFYGVEGFLAGQSTLDAIERTAVDDPAGKTILHLQCHFGLASLSWARLGARVTAVDFSEESIRQAEELSRKSGLHERARFIQSDIFDMDGRLSETFDVVFTTYGVITWLSDLDRWAKVVARHLKGGGRLFLAEIHPASVIFDNEVPQWTVRYDYFHSDDPAIVSNPTPDYADPAYVSKSETHEWQWTLSDIFRSLQGAGLEIIEFNEYPYSCYRQFPTMTKRDDGFWHLPKGSPRIPLLFSVKAQHRHP